MEQSAHDPARPAGPPDFPPVADAAGRATRPDGTCTGGKMAKISKQNAKDTVTVPGFEGHLQDLDGLTVSYESYTDHMDLAPMLVGLPDDACQCPHWGIVTKGRVEYRYTDGTTEVINAGEAFAVHPGHTPVYRPGTELVEFSPTDELARTSEVLLANVEKMMGGAPG
jgi:hypothetical protein